MRYFREKLQWRNVTQDVKHYEDCEQLFLSVGKSYCTEALLYFLGMNGKDDRIVKNTYHILDVGDNKKLSYDSVLSKFIDEIRLLPHLAVASEDEGEISTPDEQGFVKNYS